MNKKFLNACQDGNINIVKELINTIDPSANNNYAIKWAAQNGHKDVV